MNYKHTLIIGIIGADNESYIRLRIKIQNGVSYMKKIAVDSERLDAAKKLRQVGSWDEL